MSSQNHEIWRDNPRLNEILAVHLQVAEAGQPLTNPLQLAAAENSNTRLNAKEGFP